MLVGGRWTDWVQRVGVADALGRGIFSGGCSTRIFHVLILTIKAVLVYFVTLISVGRMFSVKSVF